MFLCTLKVVRVKKVCVLSHPTLLLKRLVSRHRVTHSHNLRLAAGLARRNRFSTAALVVIGRVRWVWADQSEQSITIVVVLYARVLGRGKMFIYSDPTILFKTKSELNILKCIDHCFRNRNVSYFIPLVFQWINTLFNVFVNVQTPLGSYFAVLYWEKVLILLQKFLHNFIIEQYYH